MIMAPTFIKTYVRTLFLFPKKKILSPEGSKIIPFLENYDLAILSRKKKDVFWV